MSAEAARTLSEPRLRRLVEIELEDAGILAPGTGGPLGDHVAYVWIDTPRPGAVVIETRVADRPVLRRELAITNLPADVAARYVALTATWMIRVQAQPVRPRRTVAARRPTPEELELAARRMPAVVLDAGATGVALPGADAALAGPSLGVSFRNLGASEQLFARLLAGPLPEGAWRWFEVGLAGEYRVALGASWRLALGASAAASAVQVGGASEIDGDPGESGTWSARATGLVAIEHRLGPNAWLGVGVEPGAIVRTVSYRDETGRARTLEGPWLAAAVILHVERRASSAPAPAQPARPAAATRSTASHAAPTRSR